MEIKRVLKGFRYFTGNTEIAGFPGVAEQAGLHLVAGADPQLQFYTALVDRKKYKEGF